MSHALVTVGPEHATTRAAPDDWVATPDLTERIQAVAQQSVQMQMDESAAAAAAAPIHSHNPMPLAAQTEQPHPPTAVASSTQDAPEADRTSESARSAPAQQPANAATLVAEEFPVQRGSPRHAHDLGLAAASGRCGISSLYRDVLQSVFAFLDSPDFARITVVSSGWLDVAVNMPCDEWQTQYSTESELLCVLASPLRRHVTSLYWTMDDEDDVPPVMSASLLTLVSEKMTQLKRARLPVRRRTHRRRFRCSWPRQRFLRPYTARGSFAFAPRRLIDAQIQPICHRVNVILYMLEARTTQLQQQASKRARWVEDDATANVRAVVRLCSMRAEVCVTAVGKSRSRGSQITLLTRE